MLQPLQVATYQASRAATTPSASAALTAICSIEAVQCNHKIKQDTTSAYVLDTFLLSTATPSDQNPMLAATWEPTNGVTDTTRTPDVTVARPYLLGYELMKDLGQLGSSCERVGTKCRLCQNVVAYVKTMNRGARPVARMVQSSKTKQRELQELVTTFVAIVVRAQHAPGKNVARQPNCGNEPRIAELLAAFLGLTDAAAAA